MDKKLVTLTSLLLFIVSGYFSYSYFSGRIGSGGLISNTNEYTPPTDENGNVVIDGSAPKVEECPTNGEMLTKAHRALWERRRPLIVMVENSVDARPQSGITSADVVYEVVAEGGITRFALVYYCKDTDGYVGPIRSARVYFVDFASEYGQNPLYAHVGGANCNKTTGSGCANGAPADALGKIQKLGWYGKNDLNHVPFPVMWRDYDRLPGRVTEHTVYSTTEKLWGYAKDKRGLTDTDKEGSKWTKGFEAWKFKDDKPSSTPLAKIVFDFWEGKSDFSVSWQYDKPTNSFKRFNGGASHVDKNNSNQIVSKNVVVAFMDESVAKDGYDAGQHMLYKTIGEGEAIVFQDGTSIKGKWRKRTATSRIRFFDAKGSEIALNRGQTFIEIVPKGNSVSY